MPFELSGHPSVTGDKRKMNSDTGMPGTLFVDLVGIKKKKKLS